MSFLQLRGGLMELILYLNLCFFTFLNEYVLVLEIDLKTKNYENPDLSMNFKILTAD
jgi:hypothetical protein